MPYDRKATEMRMRDQLVVVIAVALATIAIAGNVFAHTRAEERRAQMAQAGIEAAWSYPVMDTATSMQPAVTSDPLTSNGGADDRTDRRETTEPSGDSSASCSDEQRCTADEVLDQEFRSHGQKVSAYVHALGFEEGVDGPRGSYVRQIARPDIENDGPPRSERGAENQDSKDERTPPGQDSKDERTPPGQDSKDERTPPGQSNKDG